MPVTSPDGQLGAALGGLALSASLVELAGGFARRGMDPPPGSAVEVVASPAEPIEVLTCRGEVCGNAGRPETVEHRQFRDEPCPLGCGIFGLHPHGRSRPGRAVRVIHCCWRSTNQSWPMSSMAWPRSPAGILAWASLLAGIGASLAANVSAADSTSIGRLVAAWPPVALLLAWELLMQVRAPTVASGRTTVE